MGTVVEPEVGIAAGTVRDRLESDLVVFKGIPFAEPPARFAAPQRVKAWAGTLDALSYGPPPPQSGIFGTDVIAGSTDGWLTVNVWTPDLAANLPVMVWIQGGGHLFGTSGAPANRGLLHHFHGPATEDPGVRRRHPGPDPRVPLAALIPVVGRTPTHYRPDRGGPRRRE